MLLSSGITDSQLSMFDDNNNMLQLSPKNQEVLNKIFKELILSLTKPFVEFIDILLEHLLCLDINCNDSSIDYNIKLQSLGNSVSLELIYSRNLITKLSSSIKNNSDLSPVDYIPVNLNILQKIHSIMIHFLQILSEQLELPNFATLFKKILISTFKDFEIVFESFKILDQILQNLFINAKQTGLSDSSIFNVDNSLLEQIQIFTRNNSIWYRELILNSNSLNEYITNHVTNTTPTTTPNNQNNSNDILNIIADIKFQDFLETRKLRLNISNRRIF
ncbi:hypothetical protein Kpol_1002p102 [Vanderwaltozyma polyspora DSM 70294]|uniref:Uncharacterized protein n=1 Tax=Vanderwaltozyma polyspora (strain ATCC 22028 / DSM 70294 / BCRC 21397 / CBS 2163 / NBRC 10782 / NRRL Y-8283 / UCD 57-17) TaxID=436907 RepID=A7TED2_VANPO|nr:uncharacterized protein Kpol_1002p102 [Vanderwaltozyma polyspora DSM 70294]EDO19454.1 hypothetical protein Kpol_1002p102 [Vanderwaltozyma polyspora DSM 70294]